MSARLKIFAVGEAVFGNVNLVKGLTLCFLTGFFVRLVPELLAGSQPIGFDTIYYAVVMKNGVVWQHWSSFFTSTWLLYAVIVPLHSVLNADPFLLLKVLAPILYGLNVAGVFWVAKKMLGWNVHMALLAGALFAFQLASLRISWDLLRNTLGMAILLFTLPFVGNLDSKRGLVGFVVLSLLTVFAHEYAAVTLLVIILGLMSWRLVKGKNEIVRVRQLLAILPALTVFLVGIYLRVFPISYAVNTNVINAGDVVSVRPFGLPFLVDYLSVRSSVDFYNSYWSLASSVLVLFALLYLSYLFLVWKGFFKNNILSIWTALLLIGSFGCLVVPFSALEYWHRWMFMLVYPFTFYAVNGLSKMFRMFNGGGFQFSLSKKVKGMVLLTVLLGGAYLLSPVLMVNAGTSVSSITATYVYFSNSPTVPYGDVDGVIQAMHWLDGNMNADSCVILHRAFWSWGQLYLDKSHEIVQFENNIETAVNVALEHSFGSVFFVWWNEPIGWYGLSVPDYFIQVQDFGRISVYGLVR